MQSCGDVRLVRHRSWAYQRLMGWPGAIWLGLHNYFLKRVVLGFGFFDFNLILVGLEPKLK